MSRKELRIEIHVPEVEGEPGSSGLEFPEAARQTWHPPPWSGGNENEIFTWVIGVLASGIVYDTVKAPVKAAVKAVVAEVIAVLKHSRANGEGLLADQNTLLEIALFEARRRENGNFQTEWDDITVTRLRIDDDCDEDGSVLFVGFPHGQYLFRFKNQLNEKTHEVIIESDGSIVSHTIN